MKADAYSSYIALQTIVGSYISLTAFMPGSPVIAADRVLVCCIGVEFYQGSGWGEIHRILSTNRF